MDNKEMAIKSILFGVVILLIGFAFFGMAHAETAGLSWNQNPESDLAGYKVYSGAESGTYGAPVDVVLTATPSSPGHTLDLGTLECGENKTLFFAVTAYDTSGNESGFSNEVSKIYDVAPCAPTLGDVLAAINEIKKILVAGKLETRLIAPE